MKKPTHIHWHSSLPFPSQMASWLRHSGSFIERLQQNGIVETSITILNQSFDCPTEEEIELLQTPSSAEYFIREVLIRSDKNIWMYARSVFPVETLTGECSQLLHLGKNSLGSFLFKQKNMQRGPFVFAKLMINDFLYEKVIPYVHNKSCDLWARRSLFFLAEKKILLTEVFFPDLENANSG